MGKRLLASATVLLGTLSFLCLGAYYLALHDIYHDYASPETWSRVGQTLPDWLPDWAFCPGEWRVVELGFFPMLAFHLLYLGKRWQEFTKRMDNNTERGGAAEA